MFHYLIRRFRRIKPADNQEDRDVLTRLNEQNEQAAMSAQRNLTVLMIRTLEQTGK